MTKDENCIQIQVQNGKRSVRIHLIHELLSFQVYLHSTGIKDPKGKIICQIADIVWAESQCNRDTDPPETGILLPGTGGYKKYVQYFAEKIVSRNPESGFSDTSYTNNNARYQELESLHTPELFLMSDTWAAASVPGMRKEFVFCELGGMTRPLLRTNWAANLNTSDQVRIMLDFLWSGEKCLIFYSPFHVSWPS